MSLAILNICFVRQKTYSSEYVFFFNLIQSRRWIRIVAVNLMNLKKSTCKTEKM